MMRSLGELLTSLGLLSSSSQHYSGLPHYATWLTWSYQYDLSEICLYSIVWFPASALSPALACLAEPGHMTLQLNHMIITWLTALTSSDALSWLLAPFRSPRQQSSRCWRCRISWSLSCTCFSSSPIKPCESLTCEGVRVWGCERGIIHYTICTLRHWFPAEDKTAYSEYSYESVCCWSYSDIRD